MIDDTEFRLINWYNANIENDQLTTFLELINLLENLDLTDNKPIIFAEDFNLFLDRSLEAKGGNHCLKKQSLSKLLHIKENLNLCYIWQIRNPKTKQYTFRHQHFSGFIQRLLDYIFISQNFQEIAIYTEILNAVSTDHSPILCSFQNLHQYQRGPGLWKFNNSLVCNEEYVLRLKELINKVKGELNHSNQFCDQVKWEVLKHEIRCFTMKFSKDLAKAKKSKRYSLENKLKSLESNPIVI